MAYGRSMQEVDGYTLAQGRLLLKELTRLERRRAVLQAQAVAAVLLDADAWKQLIKDL